MKKIELLSPCGDMASVKMAVKCGADAVYVSLKDYGARKFASNFTLEELESAILYCHLYGVKIYVTVNTLISESDIDDVLSAIEKLHFLGVDALIMQDLGLISYVKNVFPNLEIHASTQAHTTTYDSIDFLKGLGVSRVVLAREMPVSFIKNISTDVELEVFVHGALCVSYSGQCLMSSFLFGRSGNKGECSAPCRFCYDLYNGNDKVLHTNPYLLSMKDLCVGEDLVSLIESGVNSLKIEGRMKSSYYVGYVTYVYRKLIDKYYNGEKVCFEDREYENLLKLYNREFTKGFLNNCNNVVNSKSCNHQGFLLGEVVSLGKRLGIKLSDNLYQGDGVRFSNGDGMNCNYIYNGEGLLVNKGLAGEVVYLDNRANVAEKGTIYKTLDVSLNNEIMSFKERKIPVSFNVSLLKDKPFTITIRCFDDVITKSLGVVCSSINNPTTREDVYEKLSKLGNTPFELVDVSYDVEDDVFIPIKYVNNLRQQLVSELIKLRENRKPIFVKSDVCFASKNREKTFVFSFLVRNEEQLVYLLDKEVVIYVEDKGLYDKYKCNKVIFRPSRINDFCIDMAGNNGHLLNDTMVSDVYMNVFNSLSLGLLSCYTHRVGLSPELTISDAKLIVNNYKNRFGYSCNVEFLIYGRPELMVMKYCLIRDNILCNGKSCFDNKYYLDDRNGHKFRIMGDNCHNLRLVHCDNISYLDDINRLKSIGVTNFRIDLLDEDISSLNKILEKCFIK